MPTAEDLMERLEQYPQAIKVATLTLLRMKENQASVKKALTLMEKEITMAVTSAKAEGGKATFANDLARKAEVSRRMAQDQKVSTLRDAERSILALIGAAKVELVALESRQRNARAMLEYLTSAKGGGEG